MDKLTKKPADNVQLNIEKIAGIFPNVITEIRDENGNLKKAVDFELLKQELSYGIVEGEKERYQLTWPGKKEAILLANTPADKTLKPVKEDSVDWDNTQNLYIEGDNLDVLKLLQESYVNRIKCIYIDPPYNTGKDFTYKDDYRLAAADYLKKSGQLDEEGKRLSQDNELNGRFHSGWLTMMYSRLKLARVLLKDDGVIFISVDDHEHHNLRKICDEIFGSSNFIGEVIRKTKSMTGDDGNGFNLQHENLLIYSKKKSAVHLVGKEKSFANYSNPDNDPYGDWCPGDPSAKRGGDSTYFPIKNPYTGKVDYPPKGRFWAFSEKTLKEYINRGKIKFKVDHGENERGFIFKRYKNEAINRNNPVSSLFATENDFMNQSATMELKGLFNESYFDYPKPVAFIYELVKCCTTGKDDIILDFFSGSATTAHAVMKLNAEDGGRRKFIMVQLPEPTEPNSAANRDGYKNICEIGKERIRRAAAKIKEETGADIDYGFRVYRVDSSDVTPN